VLIHSIRVRAFPVFFDEFVKYEKSTVWPKIACIGANSQAGASAPATPAKKARIE
jgi:hypothetical protein